MIGDGYAICALTSGIFIQSGQTTLLYGTFSAKKLADSIYNHKSHCLVELEDKMYAISGCYTNRVERLNFIRSDWEPVGELARARSKASGVAHRGSIYVVGGKRLRSIEKFEFLKNSWTLMQYTLPANSFNTCIVTLRDTSYVLFGGSLAGTSALRIDFDSGEAEPTELTNPDGSFCGHCAI
jgi:N-acetylneuraminic acid mutarotase